MKRVLYIVGFVCPALLAHAQEPADALRFSWTVPSGTARHQAIGGAMGSLGGDPTALYVNPAGLAFYKTGDFVLSPSYRFGKNKASFLDRKSQDSDEKFTLGTTAFVAGSGGQGRKVRNVAFSMGFNTTADFKSEVMYRGLNTQSSYSQKYLDEIRNADIRDDRVASDFPFGTSLAVNTLWIDTVGGGSPGNYDFQSRSANLLSSGGLLQEQTLKNKGGIYEFAIGGAANFNDKIMVGGTFGIPILNYERTASFTEADATDNPGNQFDFATVEETLRTTGAGINLKAGVIVKPSESWRIGLAAHSPTYYTLTDNFNATVTAAVEDGASEPWYQSLSDITGAEHEFKYSLITPYRLIGSLSYVLHEIEDITRQKGFITADVEYVNYKASSFQQNEEEGFDTDTEAYLDDLNDAIDKAYKPAFNFRVGGELKFTTVMVRAGAAYYGNPYKDINGGKGRKVNLSGGLGYRNKGMFIDLTYVHSLNRDIHAPYRLQDISYPVAKVNTSAGNVLMTLGFKF
ncbi:MAG TPA: aromatic hydrocarbon degradation protein [Chitinophagaceae bacterium]